MNIPPAFAKTAGVFLVVAVVTPIAVTLVRTCSHQLAMGILFDDLGALSQVGQQLSPSTVETLQVGASALALTAANVAITILSITLRSRPFVVMACNQIGIMSACAVVMTALQHESVFQAAGIPTLALQTFAVVHFCLPTVLYGLGILSALNNRRLFAPFTPIAVPAQPAQAIPAPAFVLAAPAPIPAPVQFAPGLA